MTNLNWYFSKTIRILFGIFDLTMIYLFPRRVISCVLFIMLVACLLLVLPATSHAVDPDEILVDTELEMRARKISSTLRCLVCQNQSIDDSDAALARDLRILVRERLVSGNSDKEVVDYIVSRYGDFVLLIPPFKPITYLLWLGPGIILIISLFALIVFFRKDRNNKLQFSEKLSVIEKKRLDELTAGPIR